MIAVLIHVCVVVVIADIGFHYRAKLDLTLLEVSVEFV